ncbi:DNA primase [Mycoplasma sp. T363T]|uniref:DNA primase n=1 Tax=Mycoplasma bradburyae TaxID=2963128 RepID=UPI0023417E42|nr:DNA primase [Mycoplasma bradburyae]MDC4163646.1 DNA primase [Mycoplasma bradburyae]
MSNDLNQLAKYIRENVSVSSVISKYIDLEKKGSNYKSLCPFHDDNNPSFSINDAKHVWKCFSCNESGGVIEFVAKKENLKFVESLKKIVELEGIDLDSLGYSLEIKEQNPIKEEDQQFYELMEFLAWKAEINLKLEFSKNDLLENFLTKRNLIDPDIVRNFRIGFHPKSYTIKKLVEDIKVFYNKKLNKDVDENIILSDLRYIKYISDKNYLYFTDRVMFPIKNSINKVVGFSGRTILADNPTKYLNTPETDYFIKGDILYNYNSLEFNKENSTLYICEGYMDVISLHRIGIKNAVAIMGTSMTDNQINLIKSKLNKINEIVLCLDNDEAGRKATETCIKLLASRRIHNVYKIDYSQIIQKDLDEIYHSENGEVLLKELINKKLSTKKEQENVVYKEDKLATQLVSEIESIGYEEIEGDIDFNAAMNSYNINKKLNEQLLNFVIAAIKICHYYIIVHNYSTYEDLRSVSTKIVSKINYYKPIRYFFNTLLQISLNSRVINTITSEEQLKRILFCYNFADDFLNEFNKCISSKINSIYLDKAKEGTLKDRIIAKIKISIFNDILRKYKKHINDNLSHDSFSNIKNNLLKNIKYLNSSSLAHDKNLNEQQLIASLKIHENGISGFEEKYELHSKKELKEWIAKGEIFKLAELKNLNVLKEIIK